MVSSEDIKRYKDMEASDLRLYVVAFENENRILKQQIESIRLERNELLNKVANINLPSRNNSNSNNNQPSQKIKPLDPSF